MRRFDYSFLANNIIPGNLITLTSGIASLRTMADIRKQDNLLVFNSLESIAKVQSVKSSNAIEGIVTSDERIRAIVEQNSAPLSHSESEIAGYRDVLNSIHLGWNRIEFNERNILRMHNEMMAFAGYDFGGKYKTADNLIIEEDSQGNRRVRFRPTSAAETPVAMEQLTLAFADAMSNSDIEPLLLIPCVILDFLCIHPFKDGNGRLSRLLTLLLLYKNGYDVVKYISFEEQINKYKDLYYDALKQSSDGWDNNTNDYLPFIRNFLSTLYMCYKELDLRFATVNGKKISKNARIEAAVLNSLMPLSKADICRILPDVSPSTVELVLGKLVREGQIRKIGGGPATRYVKL
jgi:Fic family protein